MDLCGVLARAGDGGCVGTAYICIPSAAETGLVRGVHSARVCAGLCAGQVVCLFIMMDSSARCAMN